MNQSSFVRTFLAFAFLILFVVSSVADDKVGLPAHDIIVLYENDVHCAVDGYAKFAALRSEYSAKTPFVTTVSSGDFLQGGIIGSATSGEAIVKIMNRVGYDYVTPGNHEFDYGIEQMAHLLKDSLKATVVNANFCHLPNNNLFFQPYSIKDYGSFKVAYIGLTTANTLTAVSPSTFLDAQGNRVYDFKNAEMCVTTDSIVQKVRSEGADYVILLAHLGDEKEEDYVNALDLIHSTKGIDVVLDGHSHSVINDSYVVNAVGQKVHYTSTGSKFQNMGVLTIGTDGNIRAELVKTSTYENVDSGVMKYVDMIKAEVTSVGMKVVGHTDFPLPYIDDSGIKIARCRECALGNFIADSYVDMFHTDVALVNGGGLRESIKSGEINYNDLLAVTPFNDIMCTATMTGKQLLDAMERCYASLPEESGSFLQVSGMRLTIDLSVEAQIIKDDGLFVAIAEGSPRRVRNIEIFNRQTNKYEPIDPTRTYTVASSNYVLKELGCGGAFRYAKSVREHGISDVETTVTYFRDKLSGKMPSRYSTTENRIVISK